MSKRNPSVWRLAILGGLLGVLVTFAAIEIFMPLAWRIGKSSSSAAHGIGFVCLRVIWLGDRIARMCFANPGESILMPFWYGTNLALGFLAGAVIGKLRRYFATRTS